MLNEQDVPEADEERLAEQMPDPAAPPQPVADDDPVLNTITAIGVGLIVIGGFLIPEVLSTGHTTGATRSAKIQWEDRQRQLEQAYREAETPADDAAVD